MFCVVTCNWKERYYKTANLDDISLQCSLFFCKKNIDRLVHSKPLSQLPHQSQFHRNQSLRHPSSQTCCPQPESLLANWKIMDYSGKYWKISQLSNMRSSTRESTCDLEDTEKNWKYWIILKNTESYLKNTEKFWKILEKSVKYWKILENTGKHPGCQTSDPQPESLLATWKILRKKTGNT